MTVAQLAILFGSLTLTSWFLAGLISVSVDSRFGRRHLASEGLAGMIALSLNLLGLLAAAMAIASAGF
ncbi:hypothetical protein [Rhizobium sp. BR 362]|uniref:hypothetical protein n=1 Tax=Rhizobium sp. BR 362 TaxID=3040670 RepID=UPI002F415C4B